MLPTWRRPTVALLPQFRSFIKGIEEMNLTSKIEHILTKHNLAEIVMMLSAITVKNLAIMPANAAQK